MGVFAAHRPSVGRLTGQVGGRSDPAFHERLFEAIVLTLWYAGDRRTGRRPSADRTEST